jgi:uncharacterized membrane protein YphA (DoxX/SURF4 family)
LLDLPHRLAIVSGSLLNHLHQPNTMTETTATKFRSEVAFANLILRLWVGLRLFMAGIDKFRDKATKEYAFGNMDVLKKNVQPLYDNMVAETFLPSFMVANYVVVLSYALIIVGLWVIVGLFSRLSLLAAGLLFVSLSFGLMALPDDDQAVFRGIEVAITAFALMTAAHGKISLDGILFRSKKAE